MNLLNSHPSDSSSNSQQKPFKLPSFLSPSTSHPSTTTNLTKDKISIIASKLITGVQPISAQQVHTRWHPRANSEDSSQFPTQPNLLPPKPTDQPRSITASVFAAARQERAAQRQALNHHQPNHPEPNQQQQARQHSNHPSRPLSALLNHQLASSSGPPQIHHHRSHTHFDIITPPNPPFAKQSIVSPARSAKTSAPAVMEAGDEDPALSHLMHNADRMELKENDPTRDPRPNLLGYQRVPPNKLSPHSSSNLNGYPHQFTSSSSAHASPQEHQPLPLSPPKTSRSFLPPKPTANQPHSSKPPNPIRDIYLSQVGDGSGKIENEKQRVDREFEKLLDTMQITPAVRTKMSGLDHPVKSAMLKSSTSASLLNLVNPQEVHRSEVAPMEDQKQEGSAWWAMYLKSHNFRELLASDLKKLRVALRTKKPGWTKEFVGFGGYTALLKRLKELLEIEWREEQHDDQVLHEILRCCKALLLTEPGRQALGSRLPDPFIQLTGLLYSEKKPGDLATRQMIVELIQGCFELEEYIINKPFIEPHELNWNALISLVEPPPHSTNQTSPLDSDSRQQQEQDDRFISNSHRLVLHLLIGPPDPKISQIVEFVAVSRRVRRFKTFVNEFIGVLMDYFWIFCHNENPFWDLNSIDEESIEAPKVPSGMTGGVEYEAMSYCTGLMKLINQLIKTSGSSEKSKIIYHDLFISGFERCLITLRKSSMNYYPMVHLELSRFIHLGLQNQFEFPYNVLKHVNGYQARPL